MPLDPEAKEKYIRAGKIAAQVRDNSKTWIKPGMRLTDIAERIEKEMIQLGGKPAFPANLSLNETAAHYTPTKNDQTVVKDGDLLKVDIGTHIDGYVADTAYTFCLNPDLIELVKASEAAVEAAIKMFTPGTVISDISTAIEDVITGAGYKPIENLTGHRLERFVVHASPAVPNVKISTNFELEEGLVFATEPFTTTGKGKVKDAPLSLIFRQLEPRPVRNPDARKIMDILDKFEFLPFAQRWVENETGFSEFKVRLAMRELLEKGCIDNYAVLKEVSDAPVAQFEHSVIVADPPIVITKI